MVSADGTDEAARSERRGRLVGIKLRTLVEEHTGRGDLGDCVVSFAPGAALMVGSDAWVYLDADASTRLGAALVWATRAHAASLNLVVERGDGVLARRSGEFTLPIRVWRAVGRSLIAAEAEVLTPPAPVPTEHLELRPLIVEGGAVPGVEHGVLFGEVRGLEVCRVVTDAALDTVRLEVGVGTHDREAFQIMHGDVPTVESLARIVDAVETHRDAGEPAHPLNRLAKERFLRWLLMNEPQTVGASALAPFPPPVARANLKDAVPCVATGPDADGDGNVVVVCSTGVDLDVVPFAADARLAAELAGISGAGRSRPRLVVAMPRRDHIDVTAAIANLLADPLEFVTID